MDLNFYSDLTDGTGHVDSSEFLNPQSYNGYDSVNKFSAGNENYLTISGAGHPFLSTEQQTFHTPSLGDEEFEIPPISLDPDATLTIEDVEAHFGELADGSGSIGGGGETDPRNAVVGGGKDPSFASTFVNPAATQGLEHLTVGVMNHPGGGALLGVDLGSSPLGSSSPMTIDVPLNDMNHSLLGHGQLTTIDQSELNAHLGLGLGAGPMLTRSKSPDQPLSAMPSPVGSLQDEEMEDFRQTTLLVDCDVSLSPSPLMVAQLPMQIDSSLPAPAVRRVGGKPAMVAMSTGGAGAPLVVKKGRKRRDPNEPAKPVSAYALFFRDTQAAIKGQNPSATFGEVSRIVASMWDSLAEEQKQVYKRKTEAAKKAYLQALAAYRAKHLSAPAGEVTEAPPPVRLAPPLDQNTITNICASNIILDLPQVTTRSRTGALPLVTATAPTPAPPTAITKIIISKQMLRQIPSSMVTVIPAAGMRSLQASVVSSSASQSATGAGRQPPPLQQMLSPPPPPRLQQMVHSTAPPPLQAKPRGGVGTPLSILASAPPPLQIKVIPASSQANEAVPIIVTTTTKSTNDLRSAPSASALDCTGLAPAMGLQVVHSATGTRAEEAVVEQLTSGQVEMEVEVDVAATPALLVSTLPGVCVRAGCNKPAVDSRDWDKEYCSNECVATHCREVFMAWCAIRSQNPTAVK